MPESALKSWLQLQQRKKLSSARWYCAAMFLVGIAVLSPNFGIIFLIGKVLLLINFPTAHGLNIWAAFIASLFLVLLFADCRRSERDDMALIPLWLAREFFHAGPRSILEGWRTLQSARQFLRIDVDRCAEILDYLLSKATPVARDELVRAVRGAQWRELAVELRRIDGVLVFRDEKSVSLLTPLRLELRQWLAGDQEPQTASGEPPPASIPEPHNLSAREILGVSTTASKAEIKAAYRNRIKECHPDRFPNLDEASRQQAEEWTKALNEAYAELVR